ncbi:MAG: AAA family ATPase [Colwellia sp.]|nr:AAA family ATPase [Colwellia sp.]NQZ27438.1 AAA family ATPase [Colwellia sp.]NRA80333.1 AAA family ATPase [Pseudoalteromonas sp.]
MYISNLTIENFRCFGSKKDKLKLPLLSGLNTLVGENDAGKTAIIDALRMLLGTRDQETIRPQVSDFHYLNSTTQAQNFTIEAVFSELSSRERANFPDYLTYQADDEDNPAVLHITLKSSLINEKMRTVVYAGLHTGPHGLKELDLKTREKIRVTYLRPLRDAEKEMDVGRNSRISKILKKQSNIDAGEKLIDLVDVADEKFSDVINKLGIVGIARLINQLLEQQPAINNTTKNLNDNFLQPLQMDGDNLTARLGIGPDADDEALKRQMLEKIGITLEGIGGKRGLGSNNLLYIACEMLLLADSQDEPALLIIEEPEAHLHPQRQLKLIQYLQERIKSHHAEHNVHLQIIVSTHSPTLASKLPIKCMCIVHKGKVLPLRAANLHDNNITFLERFIDATKSNLFFCRGLLIVEGDAENLLMPSLSKILGVDFTTTGVSIVNVGHTGLSRFANLFSGTDQYPNPGINVACLHDLDLIEYSVAKELALNCVCGTDEDTIQSAWNKAKESIGATEGLEFSTLNELLPLNIISGLTDDPFSAKKLEKAESSNCYKGDSVKGFYSKPWTLEYSLAYHGLGEELTIAACLAKAEKSAQYDPSKHQVISNIAKKYYEYLKKHYADQAIIAGKVYELFLSPISIFDALPAEESAKLILKKEASKAAAGQILGVLLEDIDTKMKESNQTERDRIKHWKNVLPDSVVDAVFHVTPTYSPTAPSKVDCDE